jgi:excisionase family DNA binding protein
VPDLASIIRQAEKIRGKLDTPVSRPLSAGAPHSGDERIKYEVLMTTAHLRQMERTLESLRGGVMTAHQIAAYLQISEGRVYELARRGEMPGAKIGRQWRFKREHIDRWLDGLTRSGDLRAKEERAKVRSAGMPDGYPAPERQETAG